MRPGRTIDNIRFEPWRAVHQIISKICPTKHMLKLPIFMGSISSRDALVMEEPPARDVLQPSPVWTTFVSSATSYGAAAFLGAAGSWRALRRFQRKHPAIPVLVVAKPCKATARRLASAAPIAATVFLDDLERDLVRTVRSLRQQSLTAIAATWFRVEIKDRDLAETLARACLAEPPPRRVRQLAEIMGYDRSTFARRWQAEAAVAPHWFIDWLLIARALSLRQALNLSWARVALRLGVKEETLRRAGMRLFHRPLGWIEAQPHSWCFDQMQQRLSLAQEAVCATGWEVGRDSMG